MIAASLTLVGVVACGNKNGAQVTQQGNTSVAPSGMSAYLDCLRRNGVNVPTVRPSVARPSGVRHSTMPEPSGTGGSEGARPHPTNLPTGCESLRPSDGHRARDGG